MLSGKLGDYDEPTKTTYSSGNHYLLGFEGLQLPENPEGVLKDAVIEAGKQGYVIGSKVRQTKYVSDRVGVVVKFADNITDGFGTWGEVQPLGIRWGEATYIGYYALDEVEIVK